MYGLCGKFTAHDGKRDELIGYLLQGSSELATVGCYIYIVNRDPNDPNGIWVIEVWHTQEEHQASLQLESVQAAITSARPLIADMTQRVELDPVGGLGIPTDADA